MIVKLLRIILLATMWATYTNAALIGSWSFDGGSGQWADNSVAGGVNLRFGSSDSDWADPAWTSDSCSGNAIDFENSHNNYADYLRPTTTADLSAYNTGTFTFGARVKVESIPLSGYDNNNPYTVMSFNDSSGSTVSYMVRLLRADDDHVQLNAYFYDSSGAGHNLSHTALMTTGTWYQVGFSHDGSTETSNTVLWVDGVSVSGSFSAHPRTNLTISGASLVIGALGTQRRGFDGIMDAVVFYDEVVPVETSVSIGAVDMVVSGTNAVLNWQGDIAGVYALQSRQSLLSGTWSNVVPGIAGGNGMLFVTNALADQKFYRIVVE